MRTWSLGLSVLLMALGLGSLRFVWNPLGFFLVFLSIVPLTLTSLEVAELKARFQRRQRSSKLDESSAEPPDAPNVGKTYDRLYD